MIYYVVDTNVVIDYTDIIPNGTHQTLVNPSVDLTGHCLVIPVAVVKELNGFKTEQSDRGFAAREALRRLDTITGRMDAKAEDIFTLKAPITVSTCDYAVQILPVDYRFHQVLPFKPSDKDMDGQIILTALAALYGANGLPVNGERLEGKRLNRKKVILLTNDRGVEIRARAQGLIAKQFRYSIPTPYSGRRDLTVPDELFNRFLSEGRISNDQWEKALPNEPPLVANEFLIMRPESGVYPEWYNRQDYQHIGRFDAVSMEILRLEFWRRFPIPPRNEGQAIYAEALMNPSISCVICTGPAGTGKTFMSTVYGLEYCRKHMYDRVVVVPCDPDSSGKLGALPGDLDAKMDPSVRPHKNALENYLLLVKKRFASSSANASMTENAATVEEEAAAEEAKASTDTESADKPRRGKKKRSSTARRDAKKPLAAQVEEEVEQLWATWFKNIPVYYARGLSFPGQLVLYDEFQDQSRSQAKNLLTRKGESSKMIITGDIEQIHSAYLDRDNNGLVFAREVLKGNPLVAQITFISSEIVRDPLVQFIVEHSTKHR